MQVQEELEGPETCRMECCWFSQMYATDCTPEIRAAHTDTHTHHTTLINIIILHHIPPLLLSCRASASAANASPRRIRIILSSWMDTRPVTPGSEKVRGMDDDAAAGDPVLGRPPLRPGLTGGDEGDKLPPPTMPLKFQLFGLQHVRT